MHFKHGKCIAWKDPDSKTQNIAKENATKENRNKSQITNQQLPCSPRNSSTVRKVGESMRHFDSPEAWSSVVKVHDSHSWLGTAEFTVGIFPAGQSPWKLPQLQYSSREKSAWRILYLCYRNHQLQNRMVLMEKSVIANLQTTISHCKFF